MSTRLLINWFLIKKSCSRIENITSRGSFKVLKRLRVLRSKRRTFPQHLEFQSPILRNYVIGMRYVCDNAAQDVETNNSGFGTGTFLALKTIKALKTTVDRMNSCQVRILLCCKVSLVLSL